MANPFHGCLQNGGQIRATFAIALQQVEGHTLRRLWTNARKAPERFHQLVQ
jgi:hypothetical protein